MPFYIECSQCQEKMELVSFMKISSSHKLLKREYWLGKFQCPNCFWIESYPIGKIQGDRMFRTKQAYTLWYFWILKGRIEKNRKLIE